MYEYHIESLRLNRRLEGFTLDQKYEQLIDTYAREGWRFVQFVDLSGLTKNEQRIDLVFERKK